MNLRTRLTPEVPTAFGGAQIALRLQRAIEASGGVSASWSPEAGEGRIEEATIRPAKLVSDQSVVHYPVASGPGWPDPVGFLDGIQRYRVLGYLGTSPVMLAEVAAGVRVRRDRRLGSGMARYRRLLIGRQEHLDTLGKVFDQADPVALPEKVERHPLRERLAGARLVEQQRGQLEVQMAREFRADSSDWLIVDGSLSESIEWSGDSRMIGVIKSHATLPFEGADQERYLRTPALHRSSIFQPESRALAPVYSWALRLWPWEGRDLLHGLVRIEIAARDDALSMADQMSSWLLGERSPISGRDARWDRLLYGIHDVERWLRARPTGAAADPS